MSIELTEAELSEGVELITRDGDPTGIRMFYLANVEQIVAARVAAAKVEALREAADEMWEQSDRSIIIDGAVWVHDENRVRWLRERAEQIEGKASDG